MPLTALFNPRSIAIVGASSNAQKIGGIPVDFLQRFGYEGAIYPVNPHSNQIQGLTAYSRLSAVNQPIDLAICAVPAALVDSTLDDAIAAGVKGMVLFSSGYAEIDAQGATAQALLRAKARAAGVRLMGPNCLGFMNIAHNIYATFTPAPGVGRVAAGRVGLVSQSGAFGIYAYAMARERGMGLSLWATTGNEADIDFADCLAWLAEDPNTDVIMGYMEGCRDGPRLREALSLAQAKGKPVVMVKVGTTTLGAQAAASHTAALAGDDAVYDALFRQHGVLRAHNLTEFFDLAHSASIAGRPRNRSIGLFTLSGGIGALMADEAATHGLDVAPLSAAAQQTLRSWVPFAAPRNPVDITGQVTNDPSLMERSARLMLDDQNFASWIGFFIAGGTSDSFWPVLRDLVAGLRETYPDTLLAVSTLLSPTRRAELEALRCLVFSDPSVGIRTIAALANLQSKAADLPMEAGQSAPRIPLQLPAGALSEVAALALLKDAGVPVVAHRAVHSAQEAAAAAHLLGEDVVLKIVSADIPHKSDVGGVALGLRGEKQVRDAFERTRNNALAARPAARMNGALVATMLRGGVECIAGVHRDPVFGPVLMFGLGGIHVETLRDVALRVLPITRADAMAMVRELRAWPLLAGTRGSPSADLESIADTLTALCDFALRAGDSLESAEINPLIARPLAAGGCVAVDALIVGRVRDTAA